MQKLGRQIRDDIYSVEKGVKNNGMSQGRDNGRIEEHLKTDGDMKELSVLHDFPDMRKSRSDAGFFVD